MILVHTLFVLSVIAGFGLVGAADTSTVKADEAAAPTVTTPPAKAEADAAAAPTVTTAPAKAADAAAAPAVTPAPAKEAPTDASRAEPPKDAPKPEGEKKVEANDGARNVVAKLLKESVETSGDRIKSDESLASAVEKLVNINSDHSTNPKAEALPLSLGEKFDFLLLKIPKFAKKEEELKKPKEEEKVGSRGLNDANNANPCNNVVPNCQFQQQIPPYQPPSELVGLNSFSSTPDFVDPNCSQQQQLQQQQQYLSQAYRAFVGLNDYDQGSRGLLDWFGGSYASQQQQQQQPQPQQQQLLQQYVQTVPVNDYYSGFPSYYNTRPQYFQGNLDAYGTPYQQIASLYPEAQHGYYNNNNNNMYGYQKH